MDRIGFDGRDLDYVIASMDSATTVMPAESAKVIEHGAFNIKKDAQSRVRGLRHARAYPYSITYDRVTVTSRYAYTDVGPDKDRKQGALGNLLEYGSVNNSPHPHMAPAGEAEMPNFAKAMEDLAAKVLGL